MSDYIDKDDLYLQSIPLEPTNDINPKKLGALHNGNNSKQLKCCVDNTENKNKWTRLNPDISNFNIILDKIEDKIEKPEFIPPINGYKSQIIARYLVVDGDDGNGTGISFGNKQIRICPHYYGDWSGGDEYGCVALMIRDIGYIGTIGRITTNTGINTVPKTIALSNGVKLSFNHTGRWDFIFKVSGGELPLWPKSSNFTIGKIRFYDLFSANDSRMGPYKRWDRDYCAHHDYKDLLMSVPFPYDRYNKCRYSDYGIPTTQVDGWKAVSKAEWDACLDTRKKVDTGSNTYLIPIVSNSNKPYNARDEGISGLFYTGNGLHCSLFDVYYNGEITPP